MAQTLGSFLAEPDPEFDWIIPGLLERQDRVILTGREGRGKSTLLRQIAVAGASGLHPFTFKPLPFPVRTIYVDLESGRRHVKRKFRDLVKVAGEDLDAGAVWVECKPNGMSVTKQEDLQWLSVMCKEVQPDLIIIGPLYKMTHGNPCDEEPAREISAVFDTLRSVLDCAVIIEAHTAKAAPGYNPKTPYGASLWMRWPEFGIFLHPSGRVEHWRGPRDEREWPTVMRWGDPEQGEWPWVIAADATADLWNKIQLFCGEVGRKLTQKELASKCGVTQQSISKVIGKSGTKHAEWVLYNPEEAMALTSEGDE